MFVYVPRHVAEVFMAARPHTHNYAIVLMDLDNDSMVDLHQFEAPCPTGDQRPTAKATLDALRAAAEEFEAAYRDVLDRVPDGGQPECPNGHASTPDGMECGHTEAQPVDDEPADVPAEILVDLLGLVQVHVHPAEVMSWTVAQRRQAEHWASATHLSASDNDVPVPDQPDFVAVGDFRLGDVVRNRQNGEVMMVTGGGIWLQSFYELVSPRKYETPGPGATATTEG